MKEINENNQMVKINSNSEQIIYKIGGSHKYQKILLLILILVCIGADFGFSMISFMTSMPIIEYTDKYGNKNTPVLNDQICKDNSLNFSIIDTKKNKLFYSNNSIVDKLNNTNIQIYNDIPVNKQYNIQNWTLEYNIYCEPFKLSFLRMSILIGGALAFISFQFVNNYPKELLNIIVLFTNSFSLIFIVINTYETTLIASIIQGFCQAFNFVVKNTIITEMVVKEKRHFYLLAIFIYNISSLLFYPFIYKLIGDNWKILYLSLGLYQLITLLILYKFMVVDPRFYLFKGNLEKTYLNALKIAKFNKFIKDKQNKDTIILKTNINSPNNITNKSDSLLDNNCNIQYTKEDLHKWIFDNYSFFINKTKTPVIVKKRRTSNVDSNNICIDYELLPNNTLINNSVAKAMISKMSIDSTSIENIDNTSKNMLIISDDYDNELDKKSLFKTSLEELNSKEVEVNNAINHNSNLNQYKESDLNTTFINQKLKSNSDKYVYKKLFKAKYVFLLIILASYSNLYFISMFENGNFSTHPDFLYFNIISILVITFSVAINSILLKLDNIGRKGTIFISMFIILATRVFCYFYYKKTPLQMHVITYALINSVSSCIHLLLIESFPNKIRGKGYSLCLLLTKFIVSITPYLVKYLSGEILCLVTSVISLITILALIFVEETNNKEIKD